MSIRVPLSKPFIDQREIDAVVEVMKSSTLSLGPKTEEFEEKFAALMGSKYAVAVNSGTSGLHLAIRALGIKPGDEVITTPFSFIASSNCILFEGATPVFVDAEEETFGMDTGQIESRITERTRAILPVHVFGHPCHMDKVMDIARAHNLLVLEDACESPLATYMGQTVGTFGNASVFGFYPNKQMTTGEGGMVLTDDEHTYKLIKSMRNQGRGDSMQWLSFDRLGYNYRISELTAAMGVVQTEKLTSIINAREEKARKYSDLLSGIDEVRLPQVLDQVRHSWFVFSIRVSAHWRDEIIAGLNDAGIQSKAYFYPSIHMQPFYQETFGYKEGDFPVAELLSNEMIILPFYTSISDEDLVFVADTLKTIIKKIKNK